MSAVIVRTKGRRGVVMLGTDLPLDRALGADFAEVFQKPAPKPAPPSRARKPVPAATVEELQLRLAQAMERQRAATTPQARRTARTKAKSLRQRLRQLGVEFKTDERTTT